MFLWENILVDLKAKLKASVEWHIKKLPEL